MDHDSHLVDVEFGIYDEDQNRLTDFRIQLEAPGGGTDALIAEAHRQMTDIIRQWLFLVDEIRQSYEKRGTGPTSAA